MQESHKHMEEHTATIKKLPEELQKKGESYSGVSLKNVRIHYHSDAPQQVACHGFAKGNQIYLAPGKEHILPHELGHVIQQKQGRVAPQAQFKGYSWNVNQQLEKEADEIGEDITKGSITETPLRNGKYSSEIIQGEAWDNTKFGDFIMDEHHAKIEQFANSNHLIISFRKAGPDTIKRLKTGAARKGHDVLEKSIKEESINKMSMKHQEIQGVRDVTEKKNQINKLRGLVGHWSKSKDANDKEVITLSGVYLSNLGKKANSESGTEDADRLKSLLRDSGSQVNTEFIMKASGKNHEITYATITPALCDKLNISEDCGYSKYFVTGDYDLHDLYDSITKTPVQEQETSMLQNLSNCLYDEPNTTVDYINDDMSYIRHGVQFNYVKFMQENEKGAKMFYAQINADPLQLYYNPEFTWDLVNGFDQLRAYYIRLGVALPGHYGETDAAHIEQAKLRYNNYDAENKKSLLVRKLLKVQSINTTRSSVFMELQGVLHECQMDNNIYMLSESEIRAIVDTCTNDFLESASMSKLLILLKRITTKPK